VTTFLKVTALQSICSGREQLRISKTKYMFKANHEIQNGHKNRASYAIEVTASVDPGVAAKREINTMSSYNYICQD